MKPVRIGPRMNRQIAADGSINRLEVWTGSSSTKFLFHIRRLRPSFGRRPPDGAEIQASQTPRQAPPTSLPPSTRLISCWKVDQKFDLLNDFPEFLSKCESNQLIDEIPIKLNGRLRPPAADPFHLKREASEFYKFHPPSLPPPSHSLSLSLFLFK